MSPIIFSANSVQKPKFFGTSSEGKEAELNYKLGTQLPYMFIVNRLAQNSSTCKNWCITLVAGVLVLNLFSKSSGH